MYNHMICIQIFNPVSLLILFQKLLYDRNITIGQIRLELSSLFLNLINLNTPKLYYFLVSYSTPIKKFKT